MTKRELALLIISGLVAGGAFSLLLDVPSAPVPAATTAMPVRSQLVAVVKTEEEEKPELRKAADCLENHFEGRMVLDAENKKDDILVLTFELGLLRLCREVDVSKTCSHEQMLTGKFKTGENDDFYRQSMVRANALCKLHSTARTLQSVFGR